MTKPSINEALLDPRALEIVHTLIRAGHEAYLVGGCIRDLLRGRTPKDFDVATSAHPETVRQLFPNCRLIGKRFRLAHIYYGRNTIFEVATFRRESEASEQVRGDNSYGTLEDDVHRRDFTINALYYDVQKHEIIDRLNGLADVAQGLIRIIGDPKTRFTEDPVRMLRAVRFMSKLGLPLETETAEAIPKNRKKLAAVPPARLGDECLKLFLSGDGQACFDNLREYKLFTMLFPDVDHLFFHPNGEFATYAVRLAQAALASTDQRVREGKQVTLAFVLAAFLWPVFQLQYAGMLRDGQRSWHEVMHEAIDIVLLAANERVAITLRLRAIIREIWTLQARLELAAGNQKKMVAVLAHPRFRAAYDFLLIRQQAGENLPALVETWTLIQRDSALMQQAARQRVKYERLEESSL